MYMLILNTIFYDKGHNRHWVSKTTFQNFPNTFLNSYFSDNMCSISAKSLESVFSCNSEGSVPQNVD